MSAGNRVWLRMCCDPVDGGYIPEMIVVRAGAHTGAFDQQFEYKNAFCANLSKLGVVE